MSFDQPTRSALAKMVGDCRRLLTEDVRKQLQGTYGLQPDGTALPLDALGHLDEKGREIARELREWQDHLAANEVGPETKRRAAAFDRLVRETSFTALNRLAALRLCEERGHVIECVRRGMASDGFQLFERLSGGALGPRGETYRVFLDRMCDELATDLGVLFDLRDPRSLVFPEEQCLDQVLALLNAPALAPLWQQDETIGWIYQYFNDPAERKKMREKSAAPRNSYELAVRNQFFTPRYVVEFLTDNTLGRIWYEMTRGESRLKDQCRYLVRRPNEIFLAPGEEVGSRQKAEGRGESADENLSQEQLLKQPVYIPHRPLKDPREIRLLDPACGSMHFGLYAFDLFEVIYEEAWEAQYAVGCRLTALEERSADGGAELQGLDRLAEGDGPRGDGLSSDEALSQRGDVRADQSAAAGRRVDSVEHRGGSGSSVDQGVSQFPVHRPRLGSGSGNSDYDRAETGLPGPGSGGGHSSVRCGGRPVDQRAYELALKEIGYDYSGSAFSPLPTAYSSRDAFLKAVPKMIIEHNIHGIDIDPRCAQIAGLSLWLRAQKAWQRLGLKPAERPAIKRSNIVCAEPMPGEEELLREFTAQLQPRLLGQLIEAVFEKMKLAGEAGSLLKIEEELRGTIAAAKKQWLGLSKTEQLALFPDQQRRKAEQMLLFDLSGISDAEFWEDAEERVIEQLRRYAEQAENGSGYQRRLFADDAGRGFAFIDVCGKRYEVVLMNPPFGESAKAAKEYIATRFPRTKNDVYAAFVERGVRFLPQHGVLGAITSRTGFFLSSFQKWREEVLLKEAPPTVFADLGYGVLDTAMVEVAAYCLQKSAVSRGSTRKATSVSSC